ncbi:MAG: serine O-acetyltransferase [Helicobacter sp.]|uniref:serine O-acetyltransferase n=1 Tax=Helicobacter sp. TaxID=218 RepID=UPI0025BCAB2F|nr:serine O-acetyltransferase [Helicobacter sp.]MCH5312846.1 serine O-acetyltransferase [Helicobacter sp.]
MIKEDFCIIKQKDPAINKSIELFFNYPGLIALVHYRIAHRIHKAGFKVIARILMGLTGFITNVDIHPAAHIGRRVFIDHATGVVIGETAEVGNDVMIYQGVTLGGTSLNKVKRHPTIEDGVVIGAGAKILGNIRVGANAKIGANSVVIKDVPPECTAVGIPARVIVKGRAQGANALNKLPDIDRVLFEYLFKRLQILETNAECAHSKELEELNELYANFLESLKR